MVEARSIPELRDSDKRRFWEKVDRGGEDECWEWQGSRDSDGYGHFNINGIKQAHRVAYAIVERDPRGQLVLHHCDNPPCVNVGHLYLGDFSENLTDAYERGLKEPDRGQNNTNAKLTDEQVREILVELEAGDSSHAELAGEYSVSKSTISMISNGTNWGHVEP